MKKKYPFKFLDSYQKEDIDFFFGRTEEIDELYKMIFQTRILVVFGTSGTGKTSLIKCGLANKFQSYDWLALYIRRGSNLISSLDKALCNETAGEFIYVDKKKSDIKDEKKSDIKDLTSKIKAVYESSLRPIYLIFDQFEELYVLGSKVEQENFIKAVKELLSIEQPVKIIISIREEYLGYLYEFEKEIPQLLRKKLRVEPMTLDKVSDVIEGINDFKFSLVNVKKNEIDGITKEIFERLKGKEKTLTIQLPYLQVFLDKLYINKTHDETHQTEAIISQDDLKKIGDIDDVLQDFLEEQVKNISQELSSKKSTISPDTIWTILSNFCTLEGTKEPISLKDLINRLRSEIDKKLVEEAVVAFTNKRILNKSETEDLYELAHDSLALKIAEKRSEDDISKLEVKRIIKSKSVLEELFTEKQLNFIEPYYNKLASELTDGEKKLVEDSKTANENQRKEREKAERKKRVRRRILVGSVFAFIIIIFSIMGIIGQTKLMKSELNADIEKINVKITAVNSNIVRVSDIKDKDPTLALQLDHEARVLMKSVNILKDSLSKNTYGIMSCLNFISDYKRKEYEKLDSKYNRTDSLIGTQAKSIVENHNALYKIVQPENIKDTIFDLRFVNGIFPNNTNDLSFYVWKSGKDIKDSLQSNKQIVQVVFPVDSNAMVLHKNQTARYLGTKKYYRKLIMEEGDKIISIAPVHYDSIGYKLLSAMNNKRIVEWNLNGTKRYSTNRYKERNKVSYDYKQDILLHDSVVSIAISPDRSKIFTASINGIGIIWPANIVEVELDTARRKEFTLFQDTIICSAFSNNGKMIVTGSKNNLVKIWNAENGKIIKALKGHTGPVTSVAFSARDNIVYTGSLDRTFRQWHLPALDSITKLPVKPWNKPMSFDSLFIMNIIDRNPLK